MTIFFGRIVERFFGIIPVRYMKPKMLQFCTRYGLKHHCGTNLEKKKAQEFNKHRKTIYKFLMLVVSFCRVTFITQSTGQLFCPQLVCSELDLTQCTALVMVWAIGLCQGLGPICAQVLPSPTGWTWKRRLHRLGEQVNQTSLFSEVMETLLHCLTQLRV